MSVASYARQLTRLLSPETRNAPRTGCCVLTLVAASTLSAQETQKISTFGFPQQGAIEDDEGAGVIGQVFTAPKNAFKLVSFSTYILAGMNPEITQWDFSIYRWLAPISEENPGGPADLGSQPLL